MLKWLKKNHLSYVLLFSIGLVYSSLASASIVITGTRVIYNEDKGNTVVQLNNRGDTPALVQAWLDTGNNRSKPGDEKLPFFITPPISRVEAHQGQALKILYIDPVLPKDRESMLWLNVLELPPKPTGKEKAANYMQLAFRSRVKFFFRPSALTTKPEQYIDQLTWTVDPTNNHKIIVHNESPFHYTFAGFNFTTDTKRPLDGKKMSTEEVGVVNPFSTYKFELPKGLNAKPGMDFEAIWLNDNGYKIKEKSTITTQSAANTTESAKADASKK